MAEDFPILRFAAAFFGVALLLAPISNPANAQTAATPPATEQALTVAEEAAVRQVLDQVTTLSGDALVTEMRRLIKVYADQKYNLAGILKATRAAAGTKLGAVNSAIDGACQDAAASGAAAACEVLALQVDAPSPFSTASVDSGASGGGGGGGFGASSGSGSGGGVSTTGQGGQQTLVLSTTVTRSKGSTGTSATQ